MEIITSTATQKIKFETLKPKNHTGISSHKKCELHAFNYEFVHFQCRGQFNIQIVPEWNFGSFFVVACCAKNVPIKTKRNSVYDLSIFSFFCWDFSYFFVKHYIEI